KFREIIGRCQYLVSIFPPPVIHRIVKFGDHIAQGAARMAEWYAAVHASGGLLVQLFIAVSMYKFTICFFTVGDSLLLWKHPFKLLKSRWFSHVVIRLCFY